MSTPGTVFTYRPGGKRFGFAQLHSLMRCTDFTIKLSAHKPFWYHMTRKGSDERRTRDEMMRLFHDRIIESIGVRINEIFAQGTLMTGPTCRKLFQSSEAFAAALEIPHAFVYQIYVVYCLITSRYPLVYELFEAECTKLSDLFFQHFKSESCMPSIVNQ